MIDTSEGDAAHGAGSVSTSTPCWRCARPSSAAGSSCSPTSASTPSPAATATPAPSPAETWDGTVPAQKLLSAVVRLAQRQQRYGAGHVIDILLGHQTPRVTQLGHTDLTVFGIGERAGRRAVARRRPPAAGPAAARGRRRRLRHARGHRGVLDGAARRAPGRAAPRGAARLHLPHPQGPVGSAKAEVDRARRRRRGAASSGCAAWRAATAKEAGLPGVRRLPRRHAAPGRGRPPGLARRARRHLRASARASWRSRAPGPGDPRRLTAEARAAQPTVVRLTGGATWLRGGSAHAPSDTHTWTTRLPFPPLAHVAHEGSSHT